MCAYTLYREECYFASKCTKLYFGGPAPALLGLDGGISSAPPPSVPYLDYRDGPRSRERDKKGDTGKG